MTFRIGGVVIAAFAESLFSALWVRRQRPTAARETAKTKARRQNRNHRAHAKPQLQKESAGLPGTAPQSAPSKPPYREVFWQPFGWGAPPLGGFTGRVSRVFCQPRG